MIRLKDKLLIYEFDCLYSLLSTDNEILTKIFSNIIIPQIVYDEFRCKMNMDLQRRLKRMLKSKFIILEDFEVESQEFCLYKKLIKGIECKSRGKFESAAITIAKYNKLTILSYRNPEYLSEFDIQSVFIGDFIAREYQENIITIDEAQMLLDNLSLSSSKMYLKTINHALINET